MFKVSKKVKLADKFHMVTVQCPEIARTIKAGQFVMLRTDEFAEWVKFDYHGGTKTYINIVFEESPSTKSLVGLKKGNTINELIGPLGNPVDLKSYTNICLVGQGSGIASVCAVAEATKNRNNRIIAIIGTPTKKNLFWEDRVNKIADHIFVATEDGSKGRKGTVDLALKDILKKRLDIIYLAAPNNVMQHISKMTTNFVKTIARVQVRGLDGAGVSGSDRVLFDNQIKLSCIDGPAFDAHKIDWDFLNYQHVPQDLVYKVK